MRRDALWVIGIWAVATVVGELVVLNTSFLPFAAGEEAEDIDAAIELLTVYSVPLMAFVLTMMGYGIVRWRSPRDGPSADGPPLHGRRLATTSWLLVTTALATLLFVHPGLTGLRALNAGGEPDLTIAVEGVQWHWNVTYPSGAVVEDAAELVLPVDTRVGFELTSGDVIHSLWIPAFRLKQDAVPGRVTRFAVTPTTVADFAADPNMRAQCAELCGTGHPRMRMAVRVVEADEFGAFLASLPATGDGMDMGGDMAEETDGHGEGMGEEGMDMGDDSTSGDGMDMGQDGMDAGEDAGHDH